MARYHGTNVAQKSSTMNSLVNPVKGATSFSQKGVCNPAASSAGKSACRLNVGQTNM